MVKILLLLHERDDIENGLYRAETEKYFSANKNAHPTEWAEPKKIEKYAKEYSTFWGMDIPRLSEKGKKNAILMLDFRKEIFGFRLDFIKIEKQKGKRLL